MVDFSKLSNEELLSQAYKSGLRTKPQASEVPQSLGRTLLDQGLQGATFAYGDDISNFLGSVMASLVTDESFSDLYKDSKASSKERLQKQREQRPITSIGANLAGALPTAAALSTTSGAKALGNLSRRYGLPGAVGAGALGGEVAQRVYESGEAEEGKKLEALTRPGISVGGVLGGSVPAVGRAVSGVRDLVAPKIEPAKRKLVDLAKKYDIPLGLDDLVDSKFYQNLIQKGGNLPFSKSEKIAENQMKQFTKAIAKSVGLEDVDLLTPNNIDKAFDNLSVNFDKLTKGKDFNITDDALDQLAKIETNVSDGLYSELANKTFKNYLDKILNATKDNQVSGNSLSKLRAEFNKIGRKSQDLGIKQMSKDFENSLINMIGDDANKTLKDLKYKYKNLIAIEPLATKNQVEGFISPALLTNRVRSVYGRDFSRGKAGELGDLALIGQAIKQKVPDSGTAIGNLITQSLTTGSLPLAAIAPATIPYMGGGFALNRALQSRNVNPKVLDRALTNRKATELPTIGSGVFGGNTSAILQ